MSEIGTFNPSDSVSIEDLKEFVDHIEGDDYVLEQDWSKGEIVVRKRVNQKLDTSMES